MEALSSIDFQIIFNIIFFVIIGFSLIGGLIGIWKGIWKTSFKLLFTGGLCLLVIFLTPTISRAICQINLGKFIPDKGILINETVVPITTIDETLCNVLIASGYVSPTASASLYENALAIAHSLIAFATYFVAVILVFLLGSLLSTIFYHCLFKFFIPRKIRKRHKVRIAAFFVGAVQSAVVMSLLISPLSSIAGLIAQQNDNIQQLKDKKQLSDDQYQALMNISDSYTNSLLYKTMTLNGTKKNGIDVVIVNKAITESVNKNSVSIIDELSNILTLVGPYSEALDKSSKEGIEGLTDINVLLSKEFVDAVSTVVQQSSFLMGVLPALSSIAVDYAQGYITDADLSSIDIANIDWTSQISALSSCYESLYDAGLIDYILDSQNSTLDFKNQATIDKYKSALKDLGNTELIKSVLPLAIQMADKTLKNNGFDIFNSDLSLLDSYDCGDELGDLVQIIIDFANLIDLDINEMIKNTESKPDIINLLTTALKDEEKSSELKKLIKGSEDNVGLFQLQLFEKKIVLIPNLIECSLNQVKEINNYIDPSEVYNVSKDYTNEKWAEEVCILMDLVPLLIDNENIDTSNGGTIDLGNEATVEDLKKIITVASKSDLVCSLLPSVIEKVLKNSDFANQNIVGLNISDFNFDLKTSSEIRTELINLLDLLPVALELSDSIKNLDSSSSVTDKLNAIDLEKLQTLLLGVTESKILNPEYRIDGSSKTKKNLNIQKLLSSVIDEAGVKEYGFVLPNDLNSIQWKDSENSKGEVSKFIDCIETIKKYSDTLLSGEEIDITSISGDMIYEVIDKISASELLNSSLVNVFNKNISPTLSSLGAEIDFSVVSNWQDEGKALADLVESLKTLTKSDGTLDLANIDWLNVDSNKLNSLLTAYKGTSLGGKTIDNNGYYIDNFASLLSELLNKTDLDGVISGLDYYTLASCDYVTGVDTSWKWTMEITKVNVDVNGVEKEVTITSNGEIYNFVNVIKTVSSVGVDNISNANFTASQLEDVLTSIDQSNVLSKVLTNVINTALKNADDIVIGSKTIKLQDLNLEKFNSNIDDKAYRATEIEKLANIYSYISADESGKSPLDNMLDLSNITSETADELGQLLDDLYSVDMFSIAKASQKYSLYEQILGAVLNLSTIDKMASGLDDSESAYNYTMRVIKNIYNVDSNGDRTLGLEENAKIINIVKSINGLDLSDISNMSNMGTDQLSSVLKALNVSKILHPAIPGFIEKIIEESNVESMLSAPVTKGGASVAIHTINCKVHMTTSTEDINYWNNEIDNLVRLFSVIKNSDGTIKDFSSLTIGESDSIALFDLLDPIDSMALFDDVKEYLVYNLIGSTVLENIRWIDVKGENGQAANIKKLLFWNSHSKADLEIQCSIIEDIINKAKTWSNSNIDLMNSSSKDIPVELIMSTIKYIESTGSDSERFVRSGLISEIINNIFFNSLVDTLSLEESSTTYSELKDIFYPTGHDYQALNMVEARGMRGLLGLLEISESSNLSKAEIAIILQKYLPTMGPISTDNVTSRSDFNYDESTYPGYNKLLQKTYDSSYSGETLHTHNSKLAILLFDTYADKCVLTTLPIIGDVTLLDAANNCGVNTSDGDFTFENLCTKIIEYVNSLSSM